MAKKRIARRVSIARRRAILAAAARRGLTAVQVEKEFGVSRWTYYSWRKGTARGRRSLVANGRRRLVAKVAATRAIQAQIAAMLPDLVRAELTRLFGAAGVRRRRAVKRRVRAVKRRVRAVKRRVGVVRRRARRVVRRVARRVARRVSRRVSRRA